MKAERPAATAGSAIDTLLWVIIGTTITLLGMALGALVLMKDGAIDEGLGRVFVILTLVSLVVTEAILLWRFLHLNRRERRTVPNMKGMNTEELDSSTARALHEPLEPVSSVTEQTTRTLDKVERR